MRVVSLTDATSKSTTCNVCFKVFANTARMNQHMKDKEMNSYHGPEPTMPTKPTKPIKPIKPTEPKSTKKETQNQFEYQIQR